MKRTYFYYVSHLGRLYSLDGPAVPHPTPFGPACVRGPPLDFILSRVVPSSEPYSREFRWASPCGREMNWLAAAATPIVFVALAGQELRYGHALSVPFQPSQLAMSELGELFHPHPVIGHALVGTHLAQEWASRISIRNGVTMFDDTHAIAHLPQQPP